MTNKKDIRHIILNNAVTSIASTIDYMISQGYTITYAKAMYKDKLLLRFEKEAVNGK